MYSSNVSDDHLLASCTMYGGRPRKISSVVPPARNPCPERCLCGKISFSFCRNHRLFAREPSLWENRY